MGVCCSENYEPIALISKQDTTPINAYEKQRLCRMVVENKAKNAPNLSLKHNLLYMRRKSIHDEFLENPDNYNK